MLIAQTSDRFYKEVGDRKALTTVAAFVEAAREHRNAAHVWLAQLSALTVDDFEEGLGKIPKNRISPEAKEFALQLLSHNLSRLRQAL